MRTPARCSRHPGLKSWPGFLRISFAALAWCLAQAAPAAAAPVAPNVLLIIVDDYGIDAASYYPPGQRRETSPPAPPAPNLARLAAQGVLFTNAWANPLCSATRATIMTGRYGFRTGVGNAIHLVPTGIDNELRRDEFTLPKALRAGRGADLMLAQVGKWHLSRGIDDPRLFGWPHFAGPDPKLPYLTNYFEWPKVIDGVAVGSTVYATTDQVDDAIALIDGAAVAGRSYFVWLALSAAHEPFRKPPNELHSMDSLPVTDAPGTALKRLYYRAMLEAVDTEVGRLLAHVDRATTTVILLGDNGTPPPGVAPPYDPQRSKNTLYEQGIRVPLIVSGAAVHAPGRRVSTLVNMVDLFPTILELLGVDPAGVLPSGTRIDGVSLRPLLQAAGVGPVRPWAYSERFWARFDRSYERTIRNQRYKLIERTIASQPAREFFDLQADRYERSNLLLRSLTATEAANLSYLDRQLDRLIASRQAP